MRRPGPVEKMTKTHCSNDFEYREVAMRTKSDSAVAESVNAEIAQFLSFRLGDEVFAIDVQRVREVLDVSPITYVPQAAEYVLGVINVRGNAVPILDMRARFGLEKAESTLHTRIIVLEFLLEGEPVPVGALADSVDEVIELEETSIEPPPRLAMRWRADFVSGLARRDEEFLIILNVDQVFGSTDVMLMTASAPEA